MFENLSDILRAPEKISFFTSSVRFKLWMYLNNKDLKLVNKNNREIWGQIMKTNLQWWWIFSILSLNQPVGFLEKNMSKVTKKYAFKSASMKWKKGIRVFSGFLMIKKIMIAFKLCLKVSKRNYQMKFKRLKGFPNEYISSSW